MEEYIQLNEDMILPKKKKNNNHKQNIRKCNLQKKDDQI